MAYVQTNFPQVKKPSAPRPIVAELSNRILGRLSNWLSPAKRDNALRATKAPCGADVATDLYITSCR